MEIPFISAFLRKRRFKRKIAKFRQRMEELKNDGAKSQIGFNPISERFYCMECGQQYCGKNICNGRVPAVVWYQQEYDYQKEQIVITETRYDHDMTF